jgi:hypothetical protein
VNSKWFKISLFFFFIVAFIGTMLRAVSFIKIPLAYKHLVHSHSHVAFQGWIYTILFLLMLHFFVEPPELKKRRYPLQFKITIVVVLGILISFSLQGYGLFSIIFSTLFQLLNYWFIYSFFKPIKTIKTNAISLKFMKAGLWLGLLSIMFPWAIAITAAKGLNGSEIYHSFIYGFLHFQYNGWFMFIALGLLFKCLENDTVNYNKKWALIFYRCFTIAIIPAITLSLLGMSFNQYIILLAYFSALLQIIGIVYFFLVLKDSCVTWFKARNNWIKLFFSFFILSFFTKYILQALSVIPLIYNFAFLRKDIVLAYLHLSLIGVLSFFLLGILFYLKWILLNFSSKIASFLILIGFVLTEFLLATSGLNLYHNTLLLFIGSVAITLGVFILMLSSSTLVKR